MAKKLEQFERAPIKVFGKAPEEEKKKASEELSRRFRDGDVAEIAENIVRKIRMLEYKKTACENEVVFLANEILNKFIGRYGVDTFDIPERNIHILPPEVYNEAGFGRTSSFAVHYAKKQLIAVNKASMENVILSAKMILHEMIHLKGFVSFDIAENTKDTKEEDSKKYVHAQRRVGLMVYEGYKKSDKDEFYESFRGLNEAVVSELEQKLGRTLLESAKSLEIEEELKRQTSPEIQELKKKYAKERSIPINEIEWVNDKERRGTASYRQQRKVLHYLVEEIAGETQMQQDDVFELFFKAHFTGNILPIARIIEKTFGDGMFRALGMMNDEVGSGNQMLDYLRKQRIRINKGRMTI